MTPDARSSPTNVETVVFALADIAGGADPVHLERIAIRAFDLAPGAFRWDLDEFADSVDKDKVRVSLTDAQKQNLGLVRAVGAKTAGVSKPTDSWVLTPEGVTWIAKNRDRLATALGASQPALKKGRAKAVRAQITASELYQEYRKTGGVTYDPYRFADLVECSPDANAQVVDQRFQTLRAQVALLNDSELGEFLNVCARTHADMLTSSTEGTKA